MVTRPGLLGTPGLVSYRRGERGASAVIPHRAAPEPGVGCSVEPLGEGLMKTGQCRDAFLASGIK